MINDSEIEAGILHLAAASGPDASVSPGDVARGLAAAWRPLLGPVRLAAARLAAAGRIELLRKGKPIAPTELHGVIRLRIRPTAAR